MEPRRLLATVVVVGLVVLAGCASSGGGEPLGGDGGAATQQATEAAAADQASSKGGNAVVVAQDRKRIHTATYVVEVDAFESARSNLTSAARSLGGYVGSATMRTEEVGNETVASGTVVLRVPVDNYSRFLRRVEQQGTVLRSSQDTTDVTKKHADLEARLENLRAQRERLRELYEQANDTEEVLAVEKRLSAVQGEIERIEARLRTLENRIAYATVTVELREERPEREPSEREQWYDTGLVAAFAASVDGVVVTVRAIGVLLAYVVPYALAFGLPLVGAVVAIRRAGDVDLPSLPGRGDE